MPTYRVNVDVSLTVKYDIEADNDFDAEEIAAERAAGELYAYEPSIDWTEVVDEDDEA